MTLFTPTRRGALVLAATGLLTWPARAAAIVDGVARIVIGLPPGGPYDVLARLLAEQLRGSWAPQVVVENRTGASVPSLSTATSALRTT